MKTLTKSKRSTASATDIKKNSKKNIKNKTPHKTVTIPQIENIPRFSLRLFHRQKHNINQLVNFYWGGSERRITSLTLRILAVNAIALIILAIGIIYLGQYKVELIKSKLETFKTEVEMIAAAITEGSIEEIETNSTVPFSTSTMKYQVSTEQARRMIRRISQTMNKRIRLFDKTGILIADSNILNNSQHLIHKTKLSSRKKETLQSVQILKDTATFLIKLLPDHQILPTYPKIHSNNGHNFPDVPSALKGQLSLSAWKKTNKKLFLSAASPLLKKKEIFGAILLTDDGADVEDAIEQVWVDVLQIFAGTLILTIILSIYLSGLIAQPLRKLTRAAEKVHTNKDRNTEIPDLSYRNDEIGELSIVLRNMTNALWQRIDTIESFAADVSHELKNPLTSLKSAVETATIVKNKSDQKKLLDIITHDIDRLDRLITDISSASRLDAALSREIFKKINVNTLLYDLVDMYKDPLKRQDKQVKNKDWINFAQQDNIQITLSTNTNSTIKIWGLKSRLILVIQNILSNALSFSPKNGTVSIHIKLNLNHVNIEIQDQGPGIPKNKLKTIFERFYSERPDHEAYGNHSGLGLSICKQIIEAHNGQIYAENVIQHKKIKGAKFTIILKTA